jgi:hypothetical protein
MLGFFFRITNDLIDTDPPYSPSDELVYIDSDPPFGGGCRFFQFKMKKWFNVTNPAQKDNHLKIESVCGYHDVNGLFAWNGHYFRLGSWIQLFLRVLNDGED